MQASQEATSPPNSELGLGYYLNPVHVCNEIRSNLQEFFERTIFTGTRIDCIESGFDCIVLY